MAGKTIAARLGRLEAAQGSQVAFCACPFDYDWAIAPLAPDAPPDTGFCGRCGKPVTLRLGVFLANLERAYGEDSDHDGN
jgi:hypothetical protein